MKVEMANSVRAFREFWENYVKKKPLTGIVKLSPEQFEKFAAQFFALGYKALSDELTESAIQAMREGLDKAAQNRLDILQKMLQEEQ